MARKKEENYFDTFVKMGEYCCDAANLLNDIMNDFNPDELEEKMKQMHKIEHSADTERHVMMEKLMREFLPPIEREDITAIADAIDTVTDTIEDVLMRMYMFNVSYVREYAIQMTMVVVKCCDTMKVALDEFHDFRKSKILHDLIIQINHMEEEGDVLFTKATRDLYVNCKDYLEVAAWDQIFNFLEKCCDACEDVANEIELVKLKNS